MTERGRRGSPRSRRVLPRRSRVTRPSTLTRLVNRLRRLIAYLSSSARRIEARTGITNAQLFLLRTIHERGEATIGELAVVAGVQQSTVSIVAARLEEAKLLRRRRSPRDGRKVLLRLAPGGRELLRLAPRAPTELLMKALADLKPAERHGLALGLLGLERLLGTDAAPTPMLFEPERKSR